MEIRLTRKQAEYVREAHHRWNLATGAVVAGLCVAGIRLGVSLAVGA